MQQYVTTADGYRAEIARVSRTPLHYLLMSGQFPSGEALRAAESPLMAVIEDRKVSFGNTWEDAMMFALVIAGAATDSLSTVWVDTTSVSDKEKLDSLVVRARPRRPGPGYLGRDGLRRGPDRRLRTASSRPARGSGGSVRRGPARRPDAASRDGRERQQHRPHRGRAATDAGDSGRDTAVMTAKSTGSPRKVSGSPATPAPAPVGGSAKESAPVNRPTEEDKRPSTPSRPTATSTRCGSRKGRLSPASDRLEKEIDALVLAVVYEVKPT